MRQRPRALVRLYLCKLLRTRKECYILKSVISSFISFIFVVLHHQCSLRTVCFIAQTDALKTEIEKQLEDVEEDVQKPHGN